MNRGILMISKQTTIPIAFICDDNYVMPTSVAISSIIQNKSPNTICDFFIVCASLSEESENVFRRFESDDVVIHIIREDASRFASLHTFKEGAFCVATPAALLKFILPEIIPQYEKVLYLDGDLIVQEDLTELYNTNLHNNYLAAVVDSGSIYVNNKYIESVQNYFNSGVMLLNLGLMRKENLSQTLIQKKMELTDSNLMDQNVFNVVCDGRMMPLPIRYNFLPVNLVRAKGKWTLEQINTRFGTNYANEGALFRDAAIIHFSSKDKPWKTESVSFADDWYRNYLNAPIEHTILRGKQDDAEKSNPKVSVIIPVYNVEDYLEECLDSVLNQTLRDIEVICIDDGSSDNSLEILKEYAQKDSRLQYIAQKNSGQGVARNVGVSMATGEYIYFMDSDDWLELNALKYTYDVATWNNLDLVLFEGCSFYETPELEKEHPQYKTLYQRKAFYPDVYDGQSLYASLAGNWDFIISPAMRLYRRSYIEEQGLRFPENIKLEDNFYAFRTLVSAERVKVMMYAPYHRRVRANSTMTDQNHYNKYVGYHATACMVMDYIKTHTLKDSAVRAAALHVCQWMKNANDSYELLSADWKSHSVTDPNVPRLDYALMAPLLELHKADFLRYYRHSLAPDALVNERDTLKRQVRLLREENLKLKQENALLNKQTKELALYTRKSSNGIMRKVNGAFLCCKDHGVGYTLIYGMKKVYRKLRGGIRCCREHGIRYTIGHAIRKFLK